MIASLVNLLLGFAYVLVAILVIWQIISVLNRIRKAVEDMAATLHRMESAGKTPDFRL